MTRDPGRRPRSIPPRLLARSRPARLYRKRGTETPVWCSPPRGRQVVLATYAAVARMLRSCRGRLAVRGVPLARLCKEAADAKAHDRGGGAGYRDAGGDAGP